MLSDRLVLFPQGTSINAQNHLVLGGIDAVELVRRFGTPLYVFDEAALRSKCAEFLREFSSRYPEVTVNYASKAYINRALARLFMEEGLGLDTVSVGEMAIARSVEFPMSWVCFHGNNKGPDELASALQWGIGRIIVDNFFEMETLSKLAVERGKKQDVLLRLSPGIDPHTHKHTTTGIIDSKFGFTMANGQAEKAVDQAMALPGLNLAGLHVHLGSPIYEVQPFKDGIKVAIHFAADMVRHHGLQFKEFSPGGGFAIQYTVDRPAPSIASYAQAITSSLLACCKQEGVQAPKLVIEPGRAIVGRAGVALYKVGSTKDIPGVRKYVSVDGGMGDNIRPAIYDARYEALAVNKVDSKELEQVTISGKYCESGDVLIRDVQLPPLAPGDIVAIPASGAYCLSMASNYNACLKPPIVFVKEGKARLVRRRETFEDLMSCDVVDSWA